MSEWKQITEEIVPRWDLENVCSWTSEAAMGFYPRRTRSEVVERARDDLKTMHYELTRLREENARREEHTPGCVGIRQELRAAVVQAEQQRDFNLTALEQARAALESNAPYRGDEALRIVSEALTAQAALKEGGS